MRGSGYWLFVVLVLALGLVVGGFGALWWSQKQGADETGVSESSVSTEADQAPPALVPPDHAISQSRHNAITRAAAEVGPAVVTVSGLQTRVVRARTAPDDFWSRFFAKGWQAGPGGLEAVADDLISQRASSGVGEVYPRPPVALTPSNCRRTGSQSGR